MQVGKNNLGFTATGEGLELTPNQIEIFIL